MRFPNAINPLYILWKVRIIWKTYLGAKDHIAELRECKEYDEEHDSEAGDVPRAPGEGAGKLGHRLVEGDVLEQLHPGEEHADGHSALKLVRHLEDFIKLYRLP